MFFKLVGHNRKITLWDIFLSFLKINPPTQTIYLVHVPLLGLVLYPVQKDYPIIDLNQI